MIFRFWLIDRCVLPEIIHQPRNPVSGGSAGPVVAVVEASSGIDWKHHFISVWILLFSAGTAVADQQLNKQSNSSIFNAPFFFLYYNQLLRVGTFAGYFLARVLHENFFKKMLKREDKWRRHESQVGLTRDADTDSSPSGPGAILRYFTKQVRDTFHCRHAWLMN